MSQMPDKIWLHKDTKYNTEDIVSAYQYEFAQGIECEGIENYVEYVPIDAFIEKACEWLKSHYRDYMYNPTGERLEAFFGGDMCNDFENYMMEK